MEYEPLTHPQVNYLVGKFIKRVQEIYKNILTFQDFDFNVDDLKWCINDVIKVIEQVWKRKIYFRIFHAGVKEMNELKEAALHSFWILKLQPFFLRDGKYGIIDSASRLNATIALYILINGLTVYVKEMNKREDARATSISPEQKKRYFKFNLNDSIIENLLYSFQIRDWSKESVMDLCESLVIIE